MGECSNWNLPVNDMILVKNEKDEKTLANCWTIDK
jgi:hypothetical protein